MAERLKDIFFSKEFISGLGNEIFRVHPDFSREKFFSVIYTEDWENLELKAKLHHVTGALIETLPEDYPRALSILTEIAPGFKGFDALVFPDFVEHRGLVDWDRSLPALAIFTKLCSSEFAIRPFLAKDPEKAMTYLYKWAEDDNFHIRRLASEGCRPRLPWAMSLPNFKSDPSLILPLLEKLKDDPEDYVRKSVANNLNDISKDHPELVMDICERWFGKSKNTDWIVKRACRSLLKGGNTRALMLFGFGDPGRIDVEEFVFDRQSISIGDDVHFSFNLFLHEKKKQRIRIEYAVDYVKANKKPSAKIFQIKEVDIGGGSHSISKKHSFKDLSTRKHYPGEHAFRIIINGKEKAKCTVRVI